MGGASRRSSPGDPGDADHDARGAGEFARPEALVEHPHRQDEQQHEAEGDDRLDQGQRRAGEREELQRPAEGCERDRADPERTAHQPLQQGEVQRAPHRHAPGFERLQRVRGLVARRSAGGGERADRDVGGHTCEHGSMRARTLAALGLAGAAAWSAPAPAPVSPTVARLLGIRRRLAGERGIALTFDDGPHASGTPAVLEELARTGAQATFFLVGEQVERLPRLAAEIAAAGHEVGVHGYRHQLLLRRSPRAVALDLDRAAALIEDAVGARASCYRPPYGVFSLPALAHCRRRGWEPLLWSRWGRDWGARETPAAITRRATRDLCARDVVLLHDADHYSSAGSWRRTVAALPFVLDSAGALGEPLVSVTQST
ncbi:MAG: hypothetical protein C5B48_08900, partial [Candidatus Rokuibacteriota bacterium]